MEESKALQPLKLTGNVSENWTTWKQKFEIYSTAIELDKKTGKIQCAQLLNKFRRRMYKNLHIIHSHSPRPNDKIEVLKQKFTDYSIPKRNLVYERYTLYIPDSTPK